MSSSFHSSTAAAGAGSAAGAGVSAGAGSAAGGLPSIPKSSLFFLGAGANNAAFSYQDPSDGGDKVAKIPLLFLIILGNDGSPNINYSHIEHKKFKGRLKESSVQWDFDQRFTSLAIKADLPDRLNRLYQEYPQGLLAPTQVAIQDGPKSLNAVSMNQLNRAHYRQATDVEIAIFILDFFRYTGRWFFDASSSENILVDRQTGKIALSPDYGQALRRGSDVSDETIREILSQGFSGNEQKDCYWFPVEEFIKAHAQAPAQSWWVKGLDGQVRWELKPASERLPESRLILEAFDALLQKISRSPITYFCKTPNEIEIQGAELFRSDLFVLGHWLRKALDKPNQGEFVGSVKEFNPEEIYKRIRDYLDLIKKKLGDKDATEENEKFTELFPDFQWKISGELEEKKLPEPSPSRRGAFAFGASSAAVSEAPYPESFKDLVRRICNALPEDSVRKQVMNYFQKKINSPTHSKTNDQFKQDLMQLERLLSHQASFFKSRSHAKLPKIFEDFSSELNNFRENLRSQGQSIADFKLIVESSQPPQNIKTFKQMRKEMVEEASKEPQKPEIDGGYGIQ